MLAKLLSTPFPAVGARPSLVGFKTDAFSRLAHASCSHAIGGSILAAEAASMDAERPTHVPTRSVGTI